MKYRQSDQGQSNQKRGTCRAVATGPLGVPRVSVWTPSRLAAMSPQQVVVSTRLRSTDEHQESQAQDEAEESAADRPACGYPESGSTVILCLHILPQLKCRKRSKSLQNTDMGPVDGKGFGFVRGINEALGSTYLCFCTAGVCYQPAKASFTQVCSSRKPMCCDPGCTDVHSSTVTTAQHQEQPTSPSAFR